VAEDNGQGFPDSSSDGIGLKNIRSRVNYLNGSLNIDTGSRGTTIMISIPYQNNYNDNEDYHR
jgi:signal transduction histidine kinase